MERANTSSCSRGYRVLVYVVTKLVRPDLKHRSKLEPAELPSTVSYFAAPNLINASGERQEDYVT